MTRESIRERQIEATLLRIFVGEGDHYKGGPLFEAIVAAAKELDLAGATVLRGVEGFGQGKIIHRARLLRLSEELPLVIEVVDTDARLDPFVERVDEMLESAGSGGLITFEKVRVLRYDKGHGGR